MSESVLKKVPPKGVPKVPGSGRKKNSLNVTTKIKEELELCKALTDEEKAIILKNKLFCLGYNGNTHAIKMWQEESRILPPPKIEGAVDSYESIRACDQLG